MLFVNGTTRLVVRPANTRYSIVVRLYVIGSAEEIHLYDHYNYNDRSCTALWYCYYYNYYNTNLTALLLPFEEGCEMGRKNETARLKINTNNGPG
jgi:hypothetical protein